MEQNEIGTIACLDAVIYFSIITINLTLVSTAQNWPGATNAELQHSQIKINMTEHFIIINK